MTTLCFFAERKRRVVDASTALALCPALGAWLKEESVVESEFEFATHAGRDWAYTDWDARIYSNCGRSSTTRDEDRSVSARLPRQPCQRRSKQRKQEGLRYEKPLCSARTSSYPPTSVGIP